VYECRPGSDGKSNWGFREPIATLLVDGKTVGRHYSGPNWEHSGGNAGEDAAAAVGNHLKFEPGNIVRGCAGRSGSLADHAAPSLCSSSAQ